MNFNDLNWQPPISYSEPNSEALKALEQEPIIHCKNCKYWQEWENGAGSCHWGDMWVGSDYYDYCSFAEPKGSDNE